MKWIVFTGTWQVTNKEVEDDVRDATRNVINSGNGIITGGATGVDFFCMDEVYKLNKLELLRVILPVKMDYYIEHYHEAYEKCRIDLKACNDLCDLLQNIKKQSPVSVLEMHYTTLTSE